MLRPPKPAVAARLPRASPTPLAPGKYILVCLLVCSNYERCFAFIEFRCADEATCGMALDGIVYDGISLKINRPKDYVPPTGGTPCGHT